MCLKVYNYCFNTLDANNVATQKFLPPIATNRKSLTSDKANNFSHGFLNYSNIKVFRFSFILFAG